MDSIEAEHRRDVLAWIDSGVEIFRLAKPATPPKHLVSYCVLIDSDRREVLLVDHRDAQRWLPTGGHVDPGEHPAKAAARELSEELGVKPTLHPALGGEPQMVTVTETGGLSSGHTDVSLWFVFDGSTGQPIEPDAREFADVRWWPFDDIDPLGDDAFDPHFPRFLSKLTTALAGG